MNIKKTMDKANVKNHDGIDGFDLKQFIMKIWIPLVQTFIDVYSKYWVPYNIGSAFNDVFDNMVSSPLPVDYWPEMIQIPTECVPEFYWPQVISILGQGGSNLDDDDSNIEHVSWTLD